MLIVLLIFLLWLPLAMAVNRHRLLAVRRHRFAALRPVSLHGAGRVPGTVMRLAFAGLSERSARR